jgi:hypothetical protein
MEFIIANKEVILAVAAFIVSEVMGANPNWKYNGILDAILGLIKKNQVKDEASK